MSTSFYEVSIILIPVPDKYITRGKKKKTRHLADQYLKTLDAETLNKIVKNKPQQHLKRIAHCDQVEFIHLQGMQG